MINLRYQDIIPSCGDTVFHIFGCGAIGSAAAIELTRMGVKKFVLYDMDKVEIHNVGTSEYVRSDVGTLKVVALTQKMKEIEPEVSVMVIKKKVENSTILYLSGNDIAILGFDSMMSRYGAVEALYRTTIKPNLVIDGRMGAEHYQQYVTKSLNEYRKIWYPDSEGDPEPCTAKATGYCSSFAGSMIGNTVRKIITKQPYSKQFSFNFPTMLLDYKQQKM
tara:strand:+ start:2958 stop:3617 length:660 start_codon:yes stop_codon:yes gene_type:complete